MNYMPLIPSAIHQLVNHPLFAKTDLTTLVAVSNGAAYLPPELSKKFMKFVKSAALMAEGQSRLLHVNLTLTTEKFRLRYV